MIKFDPNTRIIDLTVGELVDVIHHAVQPQTNDTVAQPKRLVYGISGIASLFNCSIATANRIKASHKIDRAITQCGRTITVDADLALELLKV